MPWLMKQKLRCIYLLSQLALVLDVECLGGVGECGLEFRSSMAKINDRHIPDKYSSNILEQICKISLKWSHFKTQSGYYHIGKIPTHVKITEININMYYYHWH